MPAAESNPPRAAWRRRSTSRRRSSGRRTAPTRGASPTPARASRTAAISSALAPRDHVVVADDVFYGTRNLLLETFGRWGLEASVVRMDEIAEVEKALRRETRLVWIET